jgi:hypothetical protein
MLRDFLSYFVCLYTYEFLLSLCKIARSSVILLLPLFRAFSITKNVPCRVFEIRNIYQKQIKYHVFNAVTNSELTELVSVFTIRPAFPTSVKKVNTSFKTFPSPNPFLFRILFKVPATWQCVDHKNVVVPEM